MKSKTNQALSVPTPKPFEVKSLSSLVPKPKKKIVEESGEKVAQIQQNQLSNIGKKSNDSPRIDNKTAQKPKKLTSLPSWLDEPCSEDMFSTSFTETKNWFNVIPDELTNNSDEEFLVTSDLAGKIRTKVEDEFRSLSQKIQKSRATMKLSGDEKWIQDVIKSGTLSDKIAGLALRIQKDPLLELESLDTLVSFALRKEQRMAAAALEALKDLFIHNLLPDRHLQSFSIRPLAHSSMNKDIAFCFWFEEQLISRVRQFIDALELGLKSSIEHFKLSCMSCVGEMLLGKPEQESKFLMMLVNKLGDPSTKVVSKCREHLRKLIHYHPNMSPFVAREVRQLISRPSISSKVVYQGLVFLTQLNLSSRDHELATQLVETYLNFFEKATQQEEMQSRLLSALLLGVNRAFPYLKQTDSLMQHVDTLFRIVHQSSFASSVQSLLLLSYLAFASMDKLKKKDYHSSNHSSSSSSSSSVESDLISRYYSALYEKLGSEEIRNKSKNTVFLNLLYRSMKRDNSETRLVAFVKRLCIVSLQCSAPIAAGLLLVISEVMKTHSQIRERIFAFTKEKMSALSHLNQPSWKDLNQFDNYCWNKRNPSFALTDENLEITTESSSKKNDKKASQEDSRQGGADTLMWELVLLQHHCHPSVRAFATSLGWNNHEILFGGDPTTEFSLAAFLNRYAYKNPKQRQNEQKAHRPTTSVDQELPVNAWSFQQWDSSSEISPEKLYFAKFFRERENMMNEGLLRAKKKKNNSRDGDEDDDKDDDDDDFVMLDSGEVGPRSTEEEEAEIDKFADELAEELMATAEGGRRHEDDDEEEDMDDIASEESSLGGQDLEDENDEEVEMEDAFDEDNEDNDLMNDGDDFGRDVEDSEALDFEDFMKEQAKKSKEIAKKMNGQKNIESSSKKNGKGKTIVEDDIDDDDDDDDLDADEMDSFDFDDLDDDDDDEFVEGRSRKTSQKGSKANSKVSNKNSNGKKIKKSSESELASAEDYQAEIEAIMKQVVAAREMEDQSRNVVGSKKRKNQQGQDAQLSAPAQKKRKDAKKR